LTAEIRARTLGTGTALPNSDIDDRKETLSPDEHAELLRLQQRLEALHTARMKALEEFARRRGLTLTVVMEQLGIEFPDQE
jgi:hypothetical protein